MKIRRFILPTNKILQLNQPVKGINRRMTTFFGIICSGIIFDVVGGF